MRCGRFTLDLSHTNLMGGPDRTPPQPAQVSWSCRP